MCRCLFQAFQRIRTGRLIRDLVAADRLDKIGLCAALDQVDSNIDPVGQVVLLMFAEVCVDPQHIAGIGNGTHRRENDENCNCDKRLDSGEARVVRWHGWPSTHGAVCLQDSFGGSGRPGMPLQAMTKVPASVMRRLPDR